MQGLYKGLWNEFGRAADTCSHPDDGGVQPEEGEQEDSLLRVVPSHSPAPYQSGKGRWANVKLAGLRLEQKSCIDGGWWG